MKQSISNTIILGFFFICTLISSCKKENKSNSATLSTKAFVIPADSPWALQKKTFDGKISTLSSTATTTTLCQGSVDFDGTISITGSNAAYYAEVYVQDLNSYLLGMLYMRYQGSYGMQIRPGRVTWSGDVDLAPIISQAIGASIQYADSRVPSYLEFSWYTPMSIRPYWSCAINNPDPNLPPLVDTINIIQDPCLLKVINAMTVTGVKGEVGDIITKLYSTTSVQLTYRDSVRTSNGAPAHFTKARYDPNSKIFSGEITIATENLSTATTVMIAATTIHEIIHAYSSFTANAIALKTKNHNDMANEYIVPMATYLVSVYNIPLRDATALSWAGLADADSYINATSFSYQGGTMTKEELGNIYVNYLIGNSGVRLKDSNGNCSL